MCGVTGCMVPTGTINEKTLHFWTTNATNALRHRGPDDGGTWVDANAGIALGHRRLSIIDPSLEGHQPMVSENRRFVITYNGEIYNFPELRQELDVAGVSFRGHSDTEVLLAAISQWGLTTALQRANGMFALASGIVRSANSTSPETVLVKNHSITVGLEKLSYLGPSSRRYVVSRSSVPT